MSNEFEYISENIEDTQKLAENLSQIIKPLSLSSGLLICLYGDIGSGKTTFTKYLAGSLGITQKVTSPSFVILNEYHSNDLSLYHFDLYRLEKEGIETIMDELTEYTHKKKAITLIEWAEFSENNLPPDRVEIEIKYLGEIQRKFLIRTCGSLPNVETLLAKKK